MLSVRDAHVPGSLESCRLDGFHIEGWAAVSKACQAHAQEALSTPALREPQTSAEVVWQRTQARLVMSAANQIEAASWHNLRNFTVCLENEDVPPDHPMVTCAAVKLHKAVVQGRWPEVSDKSDTMLQAARTARALSRSCIGTQQTVQKLGGVAVAALPAALRDKSMCPKKLADAVLHLSFAGACAVGDALDRFLWFELGIRTFVQLISSLW
jgi:hypothetical protein